jgi:ribosomal protein S18 acetylase RimI-like enzyme
MGSKAIALIDAAPDHFDAILRIERATAAGSVVALTEGQALQQALDRGHWIVAATRDGAVIGWIWFTIELRGGENVGQIFRVAVAEAHRRSGVGRALVAHAREIFVARDCTRIRLTLGADDDDARVFFEHNGFAADALTMDAPL